MKISFLLIVFLLAGCAARPIQGFNRVLDEKDLQELYDAGPWEPNPDIAEAAGAFPLVVEFPVVVEPDAREALKQTYGERFHPPVTLRAVRG